MSGRLPLRLASGQIVRQSLLERIEAQYEPEPMSGCWLWTGCMSAGGYGLIDAYSKLHRAHRLVYTLLRGPIPPRLTLDHLCRVRSCVNPAHVEPVTLRENVLRGMGPSAVAARRQTCAQSHPLTPENTYRWQKKPKQRRCRICHAERARRFRALRSPLMRATL
jgi:hypothetical protein